MSKKGETTRDGVHVTWSDVSFEVAKPGAMPCSKTEYRRILQNISGHVKPGEMCAVMGTSGSGKTTLLNVLAGRAVGNMSGTVRVNGVKRNNLFKRMAGFVEQDDNLLANLTVKETLEFAAATKLPQSMSANDKTQWALEVATELGLSQCFETKIGGVDVRGVSGGERKRCAVALELLTDPPIMFLDEPTSGLDSFTSEAVMSKIRDNAREHNRTIIASIHQPRSSVFKLFDKLMLLSQGQVVFFGDRKNALQYFKDNGHVCPPDENPADFYLDTCTVDTRNDTLKVESSKRVDALVANYKLSTEYQGIRQSVTDVENGPIAEKARVLASQGTDRLEYGLRLHEEMGALLNRQFINVMRTKRYTIVFFITQIFVGLVLGLTSRRSGNFEFAEAQNLLGIFFFYMLFSSFTQLSVALAMFHQHRSVFLKERLSGMYRVTSYFLSRNVAELYVVVLVPLVFTLTSYFILGLRNSVEAYFMTLLCLICGAFASQSMGMLISVLTSSLAMSQMLFPMVFIFLVIVSGFYVDAQTIFPAFRWMIWINPLAYVFKAITLTQMKGYEALGDGWFCGLNVPGFTGEELCPGGNTSRCGTDPQQPEFGCINAESKNLIREWSTPPTIVDESVAVNLLVVLGIALFCRFLCYLVIIVKVQIKPNFKEHEHLSTENDYENEIPLEVYSNHKPTDEWADNDSMPPPSIAMLENPLSCDDPPLVCNVEKSIEL